MKLPMLQRMAWLTAATTLLTTLATAPAGADSTWQQACGPCRSAKPDAS
ncbi:hypothetical protein OHA11_46595 [Streptomyces sp. NBC_00878]|nr:hypothetical protein [Streptomyces sp. NBC_00878]